ncbi:MAG: hypothetical protein AAF847_07735 [Bacteroidota bacterium]
MRYIKYLFLFAVILSINQLQAQTGLADSVYVLYERYFEMVKVSDEYNRSVQQRMDSIAATIDGNISKVDEKYQRFNEVLIDNNRRISSISETQLFTNKTLVERNIARAINATEFVESATTALNALDLTNQVFAYTDQITALNNPENNDLGFSLSERVEKILEEEIFQGRQKVNKVRKDQFLNVCNNVLTSPITSSLTDGLPVVGSIKSIVELVVTTSLQGTDVNIEDISDLKKKLSAYVEYYQGLENALDAFERKVDAIDVRTEALKLLLRNFVIDRVKTLHPDVDVSTLEIQLNTLLIDHYNYRQINTDVYSIITSDYTNDNGTIYYGLAFNDQRLRFPDFAVGQSRFITDEIEAITSEYEAALNIYQKSIEEVLEKSKVIGSHVKINQKIRELQKSKNEVVKAIKRNINLPKIKKSYQALVWEGA